MGQNIEGFGESPPPLLDARDVYLKDDNRYKRISTLKPHEMLLKPHKLESLQPHSAHLDTRDCETHQLCFLRLPIRSVGSLLGSCLKRAAFPVSLPLAPVYSTQRQSNTQDSNL